jgi:hypothetical protein
MTLAPQTISGIERVETTAKKIHDNQTASKVELMSKFTILTVLIHKSHFELKTNHSQEYSMTVPHLDWLANH